MLWTSADNLATLHTGHVLDVLRSLPAEHFHCCVTSPPYWGLRDYGLPPMTWGDDWSGCFGLEPTIELYVAHTVEIMREIRRVLRDDGLVWWNIGDSYATSGGNGEPGGSSQRADRTYQQSNLRGRPTDDLKPGDQCLIPHRVALALQADGWFVRSTVVWAKKSPMPESVGGWRWERCRVKVDGTGWTAEARPEARGLGECKSRVKIYGSSGGMVESPHKAQFIDCPGCQKCLLNDGYVLRKGRWRCTNSWEPIFQFAKSPEYFADAEGVKEPAVGGSPGNKTHKAAQAFEAGDRKHRIAAGLTEMVAAESRNPRNVWSLSAEPLKDKHFAAFPSTIPRRCIEASTSSAGCCPHCGSQWAPIVVKERVPTRPGSDSKVTGDTMTDGNRDPQRHVQRSRVLGYRPTCQCPTHEPVPARVLEPFCGSGTTLMVARWLGRESVGIELSEVYAETIAKKRIETPKPVAKKANGPRRKRSKRERLLF